jgi:uncharacterized protein YjiS (DUF1127 family)
MFDENFYRRVSRLMLATAETLDQWQERGDQRRRLLALGERALKDLGLSRCDAEREGCKPCWRA